jgi:hypothetical protein
MDPFTAVCNRSSSASMTKTPLPNFNVPNIIFLLKTYDIKALTFISLKEDAAGKPAKNVTIRTPNQLTFSEVSILIFSSSSSLSLIHYG